MVLRSNKKFFSFTASLLLGAFFAVFFFMLIFNKSTNRIENPFVNNTIREVIPTVVERIINNTPTPHQIPNSYIIPQRLHVYQSYNNCGPATLSMALSYFGINKTQAELGQILRPYQIPGGDNDDKSVTLEEVAQQAREYGLHSYLRPNGDFETLSRLIANDIPIVTRTWLEENEDIGHYRVIRGYNISSQTFLQDDSLQGENLTYSFNDFKKIWQPFNYEYLILVSNDKRALVESILGEELDEKKAWDNARIRIEKEMIDDQSNWHLTFALSRIYYYLRDYKKSVELFNQVENRLTFRTLWYQVEPLKAIYETGDYNRLFSLTDRIINNQNRAFTEGYILRGNAYVKLGQVENAKAEYEKAIFYNKNSKEASERLSSLQ